MSSIINLDNVSKTYENAAGAFFALKDVNISIRPREFVAVIGRSGSGKSTLLNIITGIDGPSSGTAVVAGTDIGALSEGKLASWRGVNLGIVFQFFQLLPTLSLLDNVMLPMDFAGLYGRKQRRERSLRLLELVGLAEHAGKMPSAVSGGQQQRAAIARALANDPPLLVADEPTGNLDSASACQVMDLFEALVGDGKTIVMVTHDQELARRTTRKIEIADGCVLGEDPNA